MSSAFRGRSSSPPPAPPASQTSFRQLSRTHHAAPRFGRSICSRYFRAAAGPSRAAPTFQGSHHPVREAPRAPEHPAPHLPASEHEAGSGRGMRLHLEQKRAARGGTAAGLYLNAGLDQVQAQRQRLAHEHVGVVALVEGLLQLLQLPAGEVGARPPPLAARALLVCVAGVCGRAQDAAQPRPGPSPSPCCLPAAQGHREGRGVPCAGRGPRSALCGGRPKSKSCARQDPRAPTGPPRARGAYLTA